MASFRDTGPRESPELQESTASLRKARGRLYSARPHAPGRIRAPLVEATSRRDGTHQGHRRRRRGCRNDRVLGERSRPLHARVASDNVASRRVLEKCGFRVVATERNVAEARSAEIEELVLRLEELAPTE